MTVDEYTGEAEVQCSWFDAKGIKHCDRFQEDALIEAKPDVRTPH